jgi:hypothetical protein
MDQCKVSVMTSFDLMESCSGFVIGDPMESCSGFVIGSEPDTGVELMAHMALTSLCKDCLVATAALPIALLPIRIQENLVWQQRLEAVSNLKGPHFHAGMTSLGKYA